VAPRETLGDVDDDIYSCGGCAILQSTWLQPGESATTQRLIHKALSKAFQLVCKTDTGHQNPVSTFHINLPLLSTVSNLEADYHHHSLFNNSTPRQPHRGSKHCAPGYWHAELLLIYSSLLPRYLILSNPSPSSVHGHLGEELTTVPSPSQLERQCGHDGSGDWAL
jgi:hypothetical protein